MNDICSHKTRFWVLKAPKRVCGQGSGSAPVPAAAGELTAILPWPPLLHLRGGKGRVGERRGRDGREGGVNGGDGRAEAGGDGEGRERKGNEWNGGKEGRRILSSTFYELPCAAVLRKP